MTRAPRPLSGLDLLERSMALLRAERASLALYYLGAVPFVLGLLYFWADMSRSAYAVARCGAESLALALAFIWMKSWHAAWARRLWLAVSDPGEPSSAAGSRSAGDTPSQRAGARGIRAAARIALVQTALQPWGLPLMALASIFLVPMPWVYVYFQNVTVFGGDARLSVREVHQRAARQAALWPGQAASLNCWLFAIGLIVFINLALTWGIAPHLAKMLLGIDSRLAQNPLLILNSTFLFTMLALSWLCVDPLAKAACLLRCFEGESLKTGESLMAELAALRSAPEGEPAAVRQAVRAGAGSGRVAALGFAGLVGLLAALGAPTALAQAEAAPKPAVESTEAAARSAPAPKSTAPAAARAIDSGQLSRALRETLEQPRYAWRMPRRGGESVEPENKGWIEQWIGSTFRSIGRGIERFFEWLGRVLFKRFARDRATSDSDGIQVFSIVQEIVYLLLIILAVLLVAVIAMVINRAVQEHRRRARAAATPIAPPAETPDLADEATPADALPGDEWLALAQRLAERGELRLALRALYLGGLATLAQAQVLRVQPFKSNRDYLRELARRGHAWPGLRELFARNAAGYDRAWYGMHEVTPAHLEDFRATLERMRTLVA